MRRTAENIFFREENCGHLNRSERASRITEVGRSIVDFFLHKYGLLGQKPQEVSPESRPLFELAHLNWRLFRYGYSPLKPEQWEQVISQVGRVPNRRGQFEVLQTEGLLKKVNF